MRDTNIITFHVAFPHILERLYIYNCTSDGSLVYEDFKVWIFRKKNEHIPF